MCVRIHTVRAAPSPNPEHFRALPCFLACNHATDLNQPELAVTFVDNAYTLEAYRAVHTDPNFPVTLPIWSELSKSDLLPPLPVENQAGAPKKGRPKRSRFRGVNDNCQRGRGDGGSAGGGGGGYESAPALHGMGSVRSQVGDLGVGGSTGHVAPAPRVWGGLAAQRYSQEAAGSAPGPSGGSVFSQGSVNLSQASVDLT